MSQRSMLIFALGYAASVVLAAATNQTSVFQGDVIVYVERLDDILEGHLPYVDATFEHLPLSLVPLLIAELLATVPGVTFGAGLAMLNGVLLAATLWYTARLGDLTQVESAAGRWLLVAVPLFPIVVFRLDPLAQLLAALALLALLQRRWLASGISTLLGVAARGWPVVLAVPLWRRGRRGLAVAIVAATAAMAVWLTSTPGFNEGRAFTGVHIETVTGSVLLLAGNLGDGTAEIIRTAGALYVGNGVAPTVINAAIGLGLAALVALRLRRFPDTVTTLALLVYALLLVSPLLSAQMLLWPTVFIALVPAAPHRLIAVTGLLTSLMLLTWTPESAWWAALGVGRNLLLVATPLLLAATAGREAQPRISRKNLPV